MPTVDAKDLPRLYVANPPSPWGAPAEAPVDLPAGARKETVSSLVEPLTKLVGELHRAALTGALSPAELDTLRELHLWLGRLLAEQKAGRPRRK